MYLISLGHPTEIGLQLGKALQQVRVEGESRNVFISSVSSFSFIFFFFPCPSPSSSLLSSIFLFYLSLEGDTK